MAVLAVISQLMTSEIGCATIFCSGVPSPMVSLSLSTNRWKFVWYTPYTNEPGENRRMTQVMSTRKRHAPGVRHLLLNFTKRFCVSGGAILAVAGQVAQMFTEDDGVTPSTPSLYQVRNNYHTHHQCSTHHTEGHDGRSGPKRSVTLIQIRFCYNAPAQWEEYLDPAVNHG